MAKERIVIGQGGGSRSVGPNPEAAWAAAMWLGLMLALPGWLDIALLFVPAQWASIDWEFGTIAATFSALPVGSFGLAAASVGAVAGGAGRMTRLLAVLWALATLVLLAMATVFALDVPVVLRAVDQANRYGVTQVIMKTGLLAMLYVIVFAAMTVWCWKRSRPSPKGVG